MNSGYQPYRGNIPVDEVNSALVAWDPVLQQRVWQVDLPGFWNGGTLTSAGNLVWQGTADGDLFAYRADTGLPLWKYNAGVGISAPPISYAVGERQYVAVLAGWGGASYIGSSAMAQHGWGYGGHTRRLLVFSLEGASEQPPLEPPSSKVAFIDDKTQAIDVAQAAAGQDLYLDNCMACHGLDVISAGAAPDLRGSTVAADLAGFRQLLKTGALQSRGMPRYDELNDREVEQIYWFVRGRARESLAADSSGN